MINLKSNGMFVLLWTGCIYKQNVHLTTHTLNVCVRSPHSIFTSFFSFSQDIQFPMKRVYVYIQPISRILTLRPVLKRETYIRPKKVGAPFFQMNHNDNHTTSFSLFSSIWILYNVIQRTICFLFRSRSNIKVQACGPKFFSTAFFVGMTSFFALHQIITLLIQSNLAVAFFRNEMRLFHLIQGWEK